MVEEMILENGAAEVIRRSESASEAEFVEGRKVGIGGSDAGAILGLSRYKSPFMVACEKLALVKRSGDTDATRRGKRREPWLREILANYYTAETGKKITVFKSPAMYRAKDNPFMVANLDGFVAIEGLGLGVLEIKTASEYMMGEWADDSVPDSYYAQGQHYTAVTGLPFTLFFAEVGDTFLLRHAPAAPSFTGQMIDAERAFWTDFIEPRRLPEPSGLDSEDDYLMQLYGESESEAMLSLPDMAESAARYLFINDQLKALEAEKKKIANVLKARIGDAKGAALGAYKATWSRFTTERFDTEAFKVVHPALWQEYRKEAPSGRFTISAPKGAK